jgi:integrase
MDNRPALPKGMGFWYQPKSPFIYCTLTIKGERTVFSTGTKVVKEALRVRAKKEIEILGGGPVSSGTMQEVFADYVAHLEKKEQHGSDYQKTGETTSYRTRSVIRKHLGPYFDKMKPGEVGDSIEQYDDLRLEAGAKAPTLNGEYRILRAALRKGWKTRKVAFNDLPREYPFRNAAERKAARKGIITDEQRDAILNVAAPHLKAVLATALDCGIRPKEMKFIRADQVFLDGDLPRIELREGETKNRDARIAPITQPWALEILKAWKLQRVDSEWFFNVEGRQLGEWKTAWDAALRRAGIPKGTITFYDSRRTARTKMDEADVSMADAKLVMGHETDSMSMRYNQSKKGIQRVREKMAPKTINPTTTIEPATSGDDLEAKLTKLKGLFAAGLIPEALYLSKISALV